MYYSGLTGSQYRQGCIGRLLHGPWGLLLLYQNLGTLSSIAWHWDPLTSSLSLKTIKRISLQLFSMGLHYQKSDSISISMMGSSIQGFRFQSSEEHLDSDPFLHTPHCISWWVKARPCHLTDASHCCVTKWSVSCHSIVLLVWVQHGLRQHGLCTVVDVCQVEMDGDVEVGDR